MPEGDAVRRTARRLDALSGRRLLRTDFRVPRYATSDLSGATVLETVSRGKHLLTRVDSGLTLHTHLKMEGSWAIVAPGQRWPAQAHQVRVVLETADKVAVGILLGIVELLPTDEEDRAVGHLGPDLLDDAWDEAHEAEALRRLREDDERPLGEALLDQTRVAGIGTIYLSEVCFTHGVHPLTPVGQVKDLERLVRRARQMLQLGVRTGRPVMTGDRREPMWVYRRTNRPCRRCGTTILAGQVGEEGRDRTTYWCPRCQPAG